MTPATSAGARSADLRPHQPRRRQDPLPQLRRYRGQRQTILVDLHPDGPQIVGADRDGMPDTAPRFDDEVPAVGEGRGEDLHGLMILQGKEHVQYQAKYHAEDQAVKTSLSFGAGVQTTALLVLVATGRWPRPDVILFADTGGEHDETYRYLAEVSGPYARQHGLEIVVLGSEWRTKHFQPDLEAYCRQRCMVPGTWSRWCTKNYKIRSLQRFYRQRLGATARCPVESWVGISADESDRQKVSGVKYEVKRYPLIELGMSRADCEQIIRDAGLPVPPKSGCWYCPFQKQSRWFQLRRERPDLFDRALLLERNAQGRDGSKKYLPMFGSLERIASQQELPGFDEAIEAEAGCVSGSCFV